MTTFTGSDGTVHHIGEGEDSWCAQELDGLQDDLDTARMDKAEAIRKMGVARERAKNNSRKFARLKKNFNDKLLLGHMELRDKAMIYLDLIDEYEKLLRYTAPGAIGSGTIKKLRQRGGLIV